MSTSYQYNRVPYTGNGSTTAFPIPWSKDEFVDATHLQIWLRDETVPTAITATLLVNPTHFSLTGVDVVNGIIGTGILMVTAPTATQKLIMLRIVPDTQPVDLSDSVAFLPSAVEAGMDRLEMQIQQLQEQLDRCLKYPLTSALTGTMPEPISDGLLSMNTAKTGVVFLPQSGLLLTQNQFRAGAQAVGSGVTSVNVSFSAAMTAPAFSVVAVMKNAVDASPQFQVVTISAESSSGFTASWNSPTDSANYILNWFCLGAA